MTNLTPSELTEIYCRVERHPKCACGRGELMATMPDADLDVLSVHIAAQEQTIAALQEALEPVVRQLHYLTVTGDDPNPWDRLHIPFTKAELEAAAREE